MAERRGTINFEADGQPHSLRLGTNQMADAEDAFGQSINAIVQKLQGANVRIGDLRKFFAIAAGLPDQEAGDVIDAIGMERAGELLGQAVQAAWPEPEKGAAAGNATGRKRTR